MQREETVKLDFKPAVLDDPITFLITICEGKRVLNVGATGNVENYVNLGKLDNWLQYRLLQIAASVTGIDIDRESLQFAQAHGYQVQYGDCTDIKFAHFFDLIVLGDVIEHVEAPGLVVKNMLNHLAPGGRLIITTPNPTYFPYFIKAMCGWQLGIYYDHVCAFFPENLVVLCQRSGGQVRQLSFFTPVEFRPGYHVRSKLFRLIGKFFPRLNSSFLISVGRA